MFNILFILHFVLTRWKYWEKTLIPCDKKSSPLIEGFLYVRNCSSPVLHPNILRPESYRFAAISTYAPRLWGIPCPSVVYLEDWLLFLEIKVNSQNVQQYKLNWLMFVNDDYGALIEGNV